MRRFFPRIVAALVLASAASSAAAQTGTATGARQALSRFPESQAVLYFNANRIVNEAMPRVMSPAEYQKMLAKAKQAGVDVRGLDYAILGVRFAQDAPAGAPPEVAAVVRGSFNANALLLLARTLLGDEGRMREESYGSKTVHIFELPKSRPAGGTGEGTGEGTGTGTGSGTGQVGGSAGGDAAAAAAAAVPVTSSLPFSEMAAVALDANTLVVGVPAYVRAVVDSDAGRGALRPALVELAARDEFALMSLTADLPENMPDYLKKIGVDTNEEFRRILGWLKSVNFSTGMDAANFTTRVAVLTAGPEQASTLDGMLQFALTAAEGALRAEAKRGRNPAQTRTAEAALRSLKHTAEGSTLEVGMSVPHATLAQLIRHEMSKKSAAGQGTATGRPRARAPRRGARRR